MKIRKLVLIFYKLQIRFSDRIRCSEAQKAQRQSYIHVVFMYFYVIATLNTLWGTWRDIFKTTRFFVTKKADCWKVCLFHSSTLIKMDEASMYSFVVQNLSWNVSFFVGCIAMFYFLSLCTRDQRLYPWYKNHLHALPAHWQAVVLDDTLAPKTNWN